jgi:hypothetical protein
VGKQLETAFTKERKELAQIMEEILISNRPKRVKLIRLAHIRKQMTALLAKIEEGINAHNS